jgi:hypothetical protein
MEAIENTCGIERAFGSQKSRRPATISTISCVIGCGVSVLGG